MPRRKDPPLNQQTGFAWCSNPLNPDSGSEDEEPPPRPPSSNRPPMALPGQPTMSHRPLPPPPEPSLQPDIHPPLPPRNDASLARRPLPPPPAEDMTTPAPLPERPPLPPPSVGRRSPLPAPTASDPAPATSRPPLPTPPGSDMSPNSHGHSQRAPAPQPVVDYGHALDHQPAPHPSSAVNSMTRGMQDLGLSSLPDTSHLQTPWFHPHISRREAEAIIRQNGMPDGLFLMRPSSKGVGCYAITMSFGGKVRRGWPEPNLFSRACMRTRSMLLYVRSVFLDLDCQQYY
eukprot:TRINITY_DN8816_c0_g1_i1.p1 TRINITY_DN8816_c0_g1~~TRINITY_DN8816_c0_g1_i1.p1  ORF type:complete len:288 (+),score=19.22 TRINITY_DN8816_c0_g1_i1:329-1192(+)